jgi:hypothetical protein
VTHLRKIILEELQRRNYAQTTISSYIRILEDFSRRFQRARVAQLPDGRRNETIGLLHRQSRLVNKTARHTRPENPNARLRLLLRRTVGLLRLGLALPFLLLFLHQQLLLFSVFLLQLLRLLLMLLLD